MARKGVDRQVVADATGAKVRTVTNWTSGATSPSAADQDKLRRLLGNYDSEGDAVETAVRGSALVKWRQDAVLTEYERHKYEQGREAAG